MQGMTGNKAQIDEFNFWPPNIKRKLLATGNLFFGGRERCPLPIAGRVVSIESIHSFQEFEAHSSFGVKNSNVLID